MFQEFSRFSIDVPRFSIDFPRCSMDFPRVFHGFSRFSIDFPRFSQMFPDFLLIFHGFSMDASSHLRLPRPRHPATTLQVRQPRAEAQDLREVAQAIAARHRGPLVAAHVLPSGSDGGWRWGWGMMGMAIWLGWGWGWDAWIL